MTDTPKYGTAVNWLQLDGSDNVAVALRPLSAGLPVKFHEQDYLLAMDIRSGHKFALHNLPKGSSVIKYGISIGTVTRHIQAGEHVHVHNLTTTMSVSESYKYNPIGAYSANHRTQGK